MNKNILITCAMKKESEQIAKELGLKKKAENLYSLQSNNSNINLLITGIGKQLTAINLTKYLCENTKPDVVVNIGYAGSTDIEVGKWVNITKAYNYEWEIPGEEKYTMLAGGSQQLQLIENDEIEKRECYSSESFVTNTNIKESVAFDMELHSISLVCDLYKISLISLKKISDNLSLDKYYKNLNQKDVFELTSCLKFLNLGCK